VPYKLAWRLLENHDSVRAKYYTPRVEDLPVSLFGVYPIRPHIDSIALDAKGEYLYFASVTDPTLHRIATKYLVGNLEISSLTPSFSVYYIASLYISRETHRHRVFIIFYTVSRDRHMARRRCRPGDEIHVLSRRGEICRRLLHWQVNERRHRSGARRANLSHGLRTRSTLSLIFLKTVHRHPHHSTQEPSTSSCRANWAEQI
jgi:hypothetical protein